MKPMIASACMLALLLAGAQQAQAQKSRMLTTATTGTVKVAERPVVRAYGTPTWGVKLPRRCYQRHCQSH